LLIGNVPGFTGDDPMLSRADIFKAETPIAARSEDDQNTL